MLHSEDLITLLRARFCEPYWWFMSEVRNATGFNATRSADGIAIGLYGSKGLEVLGFEVKVSRSDWRAEMEHPEKSREFLTYCDSWYLVVADQSIVLPGEAPKEWGIMAPNKRGTGLRISSMPSQLKPKPLPRELLASLIQRTIYDVKVRTENELGGADVEKRMHAAREEGRLREKESADQHRKNAEEGYARIQEKIDEFERACGIRVSRYSNMAELGATLQAIRSGDEGILHRMELIANGIDRDHRNLKEFLEDLDKVRVGVRRITELRTLAEPAE